MLANQLNLRITWKDHVVNRVGATRIRCWKEIWDTGIGWGRDIKLLGYGDIEGRDRVWRSSRGHERGDVSMKAWKGWGISAEERRKRNNFATTWWLDWIVWSSVSMRFQASQESGCIMPNLRAAEDVVGPNSIREVMLCSLVPYPPD